MSEATISERVGGVNQPEPLRHAESISFPARSEMVEWLYQALSTPKGIILETEEPAALLASLNEAKASLSDFITLRLISLEERGQVWIIKP